MFPLGVRCEKIGNFLSMSVMHAAGTLGNQQLNLENKKHTIQGVQKKRNLGISQEIDIVLLRTKDFRCLGI